MGGERNRRKKVGGERKGNAGSRENWMDLNREIILWNTLSREERKIGSKVRETGVHPPVWIYDYPLFLLLPGRRRLTSLILHMY